jgi:hypothetical protein
VRVSREMAAILFDCVSQPGVTRGSSVRVSREVAAIFFLAM